MHKPGIHFLNNLNCRQSHSFVNALAVNESHVITDPAQLIFIRVTDNGIRIPEEVISSRSLDKTPTGEALFLKVQEALASVAFLRRKLTSVTTDCDRQTDIPILLRPE